MASIHRRSKTYQFQVQRHGVVYDCSFFLTDNRLITVEAAGRKRTESLGLKPIKACAIRIAGQLIADAKPRADEDRGRGWLGRLFMRPQSNEPDDNLTPS